MHRLRCTRQICFALFTTWLFCWYAACARAPTPSAAPAAPGSTSSVASLPSATASEIAPAAPSASSAVVAVEDLPTSTAPTVTVMEKGKAPYRKLRYSFSMGVETMVMDMKMTTTMVVGGRQPPAVTLPTIRTLMKVVPKSVSQEGELTYDADVTKVEVLADVAVAPGVKSLLERELASMVGCRTHAVVDSRGVTKEATVDIPAGASPTVRDSLEKMRDSLRDLCSPMPEEEVGGGAKWRVDMTMLRPMRLKQQAYYNLISMDAKTLQLGISLTQTAVPQEIDMSSKLPGTVAHLNSLASSGTGTSRIVLTRITPTSSIAMDSTTNVEATVGADRAQLTMRLQARINVQPKK